MITAMWTVVAIFTLHCALPIGAAWWGARKVDGLLAAKLKYTVLVPFATAATWLVYLTADIIGLFTQANGWLPWWLKWASTHDEWLFGMHTQVGLEPMPVGWWQRYRSAVRWIRRNPAYHFAHHVCGHQARRGVVTESNDLQDAVITGTREGGLYAVSPWGNAFFVMVTVWRLQIGAGWKLWRTDVQDADGVCMMATKIGWAK